MKTYRGTRIIHKGKNTGWPDGLAHLVIYYIEKNEKPNDTMYRVEFNNSCKKIVMENNDEPTNIFEKISSMQD